MTVSADDAKRFARRVGRPDLTVADVTRLNDYLIKAYRAAQIDREQAIAFGEAAGQRLFHPRSRNDRRFKSRTVNFHRRLIAAGEHPDDIADALLPRDLPTKLRAPRQR